VGHTLAGDHRIGEEGHHIGEGEGHHIEEGEGHHIGEGMEGHYSLVALGDLLEVQNLEVVDLRCLELP